MYIIFVHELMSHWFRFWLNDEAPQNIEPMSATAPTLQDPMS